MTNLQAIDLLKGLEQSLDDYCELNDEGKTAFRMAITALEVFGNSEQLPSAEPKTPSNGSITSINPENTHDRTIGDCISRKDAIKSMANAIWHYPNELYTGLNSYEMSEALAKDGLMFLPSTEPEIIRCKDCKHYHLEAGDDSYALGYCPFIGSHLVMSKGFCAWGERREE